jgi:hypothetical protein
MRGVTGSDQGDRTAAGFEALQQGNPVHPRRFHDDGGDPAGCQPVGEPLQVPGQGPKSLHRLRSPIRRHTPPMLVSPHIDAGGMGMDEGPMLGSGCGLLAFVGHTCLQSDAEWGEQGKRGCLRQPGYNRRKRVARGETVSS